MTELGHTPGERWREATCSPLAATPGREGRQLRSSAARRLTEHGGSLVNADLDSLFEQLRLAGAGRRWRDLVGRAEDERWSSEALLVALFAAELEHRRDVRLSRAVRSAGFPFVRTIDEFDFTYQSTLTRSEIGFLLTPVFVTEGHSVVLEGKPGRGKTHLAIAIALRALQNGFDVAFVTAARLIDELSAATRTARLREVLADYTKPDVLVVDEVGYLADSGGGANLIYHLVHERHVRRRAMVFTTNKPLHCWGSVLRDDDLAEAIVDRILERGRVLRLDGPSVRTNRLHALSGRLGSAPSTDAARVTDCRAAARPADRGGVDAFECGSLDVSPLTP